MRGSRDLNLFGAWQRLPSNWKRSTREQFYEAVPRWLPTPDVVFMNFGYAELEPEPASEPDATPVLALDPSDEPNRYPLQLYERVARQIDWTGLDAVEVGSGRGGGACYVMRRFAPRRYTGIDLSANAVDLCNRIHRIEGLAFRQGDAMNLPFEDASVDVVINIESSGLYPDIDRFYREVHRILRPGGRFLCADYRKTTNLPRWRDHIAKSPLERVREVDITANVALALQRDRAQRESLIARHVPRPLRSTFLRFAGLTGDRPEPFRQGEKTYLCLELRRGVESKADSK
jgi:SAM-dependent methyltransferase